MPAKIISGDIRIDPSEFKAALIEAGITEIDTAARYRKGQSEKDIGQAGLGQTFTIDTKILFSGTGEGDLTPEAIDRSLTNSLDIMGLEKVNVLYCHGPDLQTPITEQARAFDEQFQRGRFTHVRGHIILTP